MRHADPGSCAATAAGFAFASGRGLSMAGTPPVVVQDDLVSGNRLAATSSGGFAAVQGAGLNNGGELVLRDTRVSDNSGATAGPAGYAQGGGIWNGKFDPSGPPPSLSLLDSVVARNALTGSAGVSVSGGGLFTAAPIVRRDTSIGRNTPDDCSGC